MDTVEVVGFGVGNETPIHNITNGTETWEIAVFGTTGALAWVSVMVSAALIYGHLRYWDVPEQQTLIIRLLIMSPVYAVDSWLSIQFRHYALYFNLIRDCYEAYALYCFFALLIKYVESEDADGRPVEDILEHEEPNKYPVPLCFLKPVQPGALFMLWMKRLILQYTLIKPAAALIACILNAFDLYHEGSFKPGFGYLYIVVIVNISVSVSLYALVLFYKVGLPFLKPYRPLLKFLSIKAVVFFSFWQSVIISILSFLEVIPRIGNWDEEQVGTGINNFLICFEMFLLSIINFYIFPYKTYKPEIKRTPRPAKEVFTSAVKNFTSDVVNQKDVVRDIKTAFSSKGLEDARVKHHRWKENSALLASQKDPDEDVVELDESERN